MRITTGSLRMRTATENTMTLRIKEKSALQGVTEQMQGIHHYLMGSGLEQNLLELMSLRVSQINRCAFCQTYHAKALREAGEREDRLHVLSAWRETGWFSDRERAALAWTEAVTTLENHEVSDSVFAQARAEFSEKELADLTWSVTAINATNRLSLAFHNPPVRFTIDANEPVAAD
jgi:AhpD family alkylhydroperoxidase